MMWWDSGRLEGQSISSSLKTLGQMRELYLEGSESGLGDDTVLYTVEWVAPGGLTEGALLWGCTRLHAGSVGAEYFMTHGHYHALCSRAEYYLPVSGSGWLLRMQRDGHTWAEEMLPGRILYIDGRHAHRVVNTGSEPLTFWACWPGDAGHDYASIAGAGFGLRVIERNGRPVFIEKAD